jgi:hypothetical protein
VRLPLPPRVIAEQDWTPSIVTPGHLQKLVKQGFMTAAELVACRVPEDPAFLAPAEGYVVSFMAFYDASAPLPVFTGSCPAPMPSWGDGLAGKVVPLREALQLLR